MIDQSSDDIAPEIQTRILSWFHDHGRQFPWRQARDPYAILLAEKLLQQTSVRQDLLDAYRALLDRYPTPEELAVANVAQIRPVIQPLGFHYRAEELVALAKSIVQKHAGRIPQDLKSLLALPGVGDYTARAVLCFAFGEDVPIVDTNVARILYRLFGLPGPMPANPARKGALIELAQSLIPAGRSRDFNFAVLDLGALVCKPTSPVCAKCPLAPLCGFAASGSFQVQIENAGLP